jgi:hypothetical protein
MIVHRLSAVPSAFHPSLTLLAVPATTIHLDLDLAAHRILLTPQFILYLPPGINRRSCTIAEDTVALPAPYLHTSLLRQRLFNLLPSSTLALTSRASFRGLLVPL